MKQRLAVAGFFILACLFSSSLAVSAEEPSNPSSTLTQMDEKMSRKLDAIEQKQNDIIKRLEEIKAELDIVKIRASLKG